MKSQRQKDAGSTYATLATGVAPSTAPPRAYIYFHAFLPSFYIPSDAPSLRMHVKMSQESAGEKVMVIELLSTPQSYLAELAMCINYRRHGYDPGIRQRRAGLHI